MKRLTPQMWSLMKSLLKFDNADLKLKPGMTANVEIITAEKKGILLVPNKALRFL